MCGLFAIFYKLVPVLLPWIAFDSIFRRGNGTIASPWKFLFGIRRVPFTTFVDQPVFPSKW